MCPTTLPFEERMGPSFRWGGIEEEPLLAGDIAGG